MLQSKVWDIYFGTKNISENTALGEPYMWDSWNHPNLQQRLDPSFCFLGICFCLKTTDKPLGPVNMQFCAWIRERCFGSCGLERLPLLIVFRVREALNSEGQRSKSWHIMGKLISSLLHSEFRRAWFRQSSKWWSWCSATEHLGFPTGAIGMKWVISHYIFWKSQKRKSLECNCKQCCNLPLFFIWEDDVLHQAYYSLVLMLILTRNK